MINEDELWKDFRKDLTNGHIVTRPATLQSFGQFVKNKMNGIILKNGKELNYNRKRDGVIRRHSADVSESSSTRLSDTFQFLRDISHYVNETSSSNDENQLCDVIFSRSSYHEIRVLTRLNKKK